MSVSFGETNSGVQVAVNHGSIHLPPGEFFGNTLEPWLTSFPTEQGLTKADSRCYQDTLQATDPSLDKARIEEDKGGLLRESYCWVLNDINFQKWRDARGDQLLWIKGDPGKGKTMLLCGIVDELHKMPMCDTNICFFFCQAMNSRINNAAAVLRGLIFMLVQQQPCLNAYIQDESFEGENAWFALLRAFTKILEDPRLKSTYLVIDALDECTGDLDRLLRLLVQKSSEYAHVRWVVSSRNWPSIEKGLDDSTQLKLCLELHEANMTASVNSFIRYKINKLASLNKYSLTIREAVEHHLVSKADGTFLWVALVCKELTNIPKRHVRKKLQDFPSGLDTIYERMWKQIDILTNGSCDGQVCKSLLGVITTIYRPITLDELTSYLVLPDGDDETEEEVLEALEDIVRICGSFLALRRRTISLVHQSAKDFLLQKLLHEILPRGAKEVHYDIFSESLGVISQTLRRDIYGLVAPGYPIHQVKEPEPDPLATLRYACVYWIDHLIECADTEKATNDLQDGGLISIFFEQNFLHWLEALSLSKSLSEGVSSILRLENIIKATVNASRLLEMVQDACRFIRFHKMAIEAHPLQVYASGLIFSPVRSLARIQYEAQEPPWIIKKPAMEESWSACLQTLEGHRNQINSACFSHDSTLIASASHDHTIRLWNASSGLCLYTLDASSVVRSVTFSHDSKFIASGVDDNTIKIWCCSTGQCLQTLYGHTGGVLHVTFSQDSKHLVSASYDHTIKLWNAISGQCLRTFEAHSGPVRSVAFSRDSNTLASAFDNDTVKIWDMSTGHCLQTLRGHSERVTSVVFSHDSKLLVSASYDNTIKLWDPSSNQHLQNIKGHSGPVKSVAFSHDSKILASASTDHTIKIWNITSGQCLQVLKAHSGGLFSVAFSHESKLLASASSDRTVRIWGIDSRQYLQSCESHSGRVLSVVFSHDSRLLASGSSDHTIKLWDTDSGNCLQTLRGHSHWVKSVVFSHDSTLLASASSDHTVKIWDTCNGRCLETLEGHSHWVFSAVFSHNSTLIASASTDRSVKLWDTISWQCLRTFEGHSHPVKSVVFSHDSKVLASASYDLTVKIWEVESGQCLQTLEGHREWVFSVVFSKDSKLLASASFDDTLVIWDTSSGQCLQTLKVGIITSVNSFSFTKSHLKTSHGTFRLSSFDSFSDIGPSTIDPEVPHYEGYGISSDNKYITWNSELLLWIPCEYRPITSAVSSSTICLGSALGRVMLFTLDSQRLPYLPERSIPVR